MLEFIVKRDGAIVPFRLEKIERAIEKAFEADGGNLVHNSRELAEAVALFLEKNEVSKPGIEEVQDMVEMVLANTGFARVAKKYILYREKRRELRDRLEVDYREETLDDSLPILMDAGFNGIETKWDVKILIDQLNKDLNLPIEVSREIASNVEKKILLLAMPKISMSLVMEVTKSLLSQYGYGHLVLKESKIGLPMREIDALHFRNKTNINNPGKIRSVISSHALSKFSLQSVYSPEVATAHKNGRIHIHNLGFPASLHSLLFTPDLIKRSGLSLLGLETSSLPSKRFSILSSHINNFMAGLRPYFSQQFSLAYLNLMVAPFLNVSNNQELLQEAQNLLYVTSQNSFSRSGVPLPVDFNLYCYVPKELALCHAIGLGGIETAKTYASFLDEAIDFAEALLLCIEQGDAKGKSFRYPEINIHYREVDKSNAKLVRFFETVARVASKRPQIRFIKKSSESEIYSSQLYFNQKNRDRCDGGDERLLRLSSFSSVSLNLPHVLMRRGLKYKNLTLENLENEIQATLGLCVEAIKQKKGFIQDIIYQENSVLEELSVNQVDSQRLIPFEKSMGLVGVVGLNEFVELATGYQLHDNEESVVFGENVIRLLKKCLSSFGAEGVMFEVNPDLSASSRFAKLDIEQNGDARKIARGGSNPFYSNSIYLNPEARIGFYEKKRIEDRLLKELDSSSVVTEIRGNGFGPSQILNLL